MLYDDVGCQGHEIKKPQQSKERRGCLRYKALNLSLCHTNKPQKRKEACLHSLFPREKEKGWHSFYLSLPKEMTLVFLTEAL